jgi:hypothetical protein
MRAEASTAPSPRIAAMFDLTDPAERFMLDVLCRYHTETPGLHAVAAMRRATHEVDGRRQRVILTATGFRPQRDGAQLEWDLILWNIDDVSIRFHRQSSRTAAIAAVRLYSPSAP